ncbi:3-galactosyl-N-acetylglucosaminide 4-alpha-L-fucosyltransferase FUT3-like [Branchiostoma floridae]|uniref:Fucosyltransferase n=2 Tax=Branchiostoma floridae TaxID=7739 RepID=A0A9J7MFA6_BRAFL|nr:3-galactosyl-N-acetylglucosaminide 4-alpha-L-fucosyltransferase FUT3-like [Branchiostoma floridae]XP_035700183.1 3-galactosyl-N-acetylglucosaminide 4-alpha-L-fucosyltransferase FUT3-like [Branchiostoma floridae]
MNLSLKYLFNTSLVIFPICLGTILVVHFTDKTFKQNRHSMILKVDFVPNKSNIVPQNHEQTLPTCSQDPKDDSLVNPFSKFYSVWYDPPTEKTLTKREQIKIVFWTKPQLQNRRHTRCLRMTNCIFSRYRDDIHDADAVLFEVSDLPKDYNSSTMPTVRYPHQHWIWYSTECPNYPNINFETYRSVFNWTITYRADSDSSGAWGSLYRTYQRLKGEGVDPNKDYTKGRKKLAVWFIMKCNTQASRITYAAELAKHISIDVYGRCGIDDVCAKRKYKCMNGIIRQYKFYLAFENMKCKEYITEKLWRNALENDVVPVVLGANRSDYERLAPPHSYIHVDDFTSPKELANYLKMLDQDKDRYNAYLKWKATPPKNMPLDEGRWCNLCRELLERCPTKRKVYTDLRTWFEGENLSMCDPKENVKYQELRFVENHFEPVTYND